MAVLKKPVCLVCGKPSLRSICDSCANRLRKEALHNEIEDIKAGRKHPHTPDLP